MGASFSEIGLLALSVVKDFTLLITVRGRGAQGFPWRKVFVRLSTISAFCENEWWLSGTPNAVEMR